MSEYTLKDGRKAVKLENNIDSLTKVTEVYVEPKPEKKLSQRIIEKLGVVERVIETLDENTGKVVDRVVEKVCEATEVVGSKKKNIVKSPAVEEKSPMQIAVEEKINSSLDFKTYFFVAAIIAQVLVLGYVIFLM